MSIQDHTVMSEGLDDWLRRCLIEAKEWLPAEVESRILELGATAIAPLIQILEDRSLLASDCSGNEWGPIHAAALLGELQAVDAIPALLAALADDEHRDLLAEEAVQALAAMGPAALEPVLQAHAESSGPQHRIELESILCTLGIRDERIFTILLGVLERTPEHGASCLDLYGDERAIEPLRRAFDRPDLGADVMHQAQAAQEIRAAIHELGGSLTEAQEQKYLRARAAYLARILPRPRRDPAAAKAARKRGVAVPDDAIIMNLKPSAPRQLGEEGLIVLWRDGREPGRRDGLACILSTCPDPECMCELVYMGGFVIDEQASAVRWDQEGVHLDLSRGSEPARATLDATMIAIVDPSSGETRAHPDLSDATDPALLDWLASEMDGELLDMLHRYELRAKGEPPERPCIDIDLDLIEEYHLAAFDELFEGMRSDEYLLANHRYWTCIYLCPIPGCDCHQARVVFFAYAAEPGDSVGSVLLDLGGTEGLTILDMSAECGAPEHLIGELWSLFERRHHAGSFLRQREAQCKAVGRTLWRSVAKPVRVVPQPGRNEPCPCGSGRKFKKCCLGKSSEPPSIGGLPRSAG